MWELGQTASQCTERINLELWNESQMPQGCHSPDASWVTLSQLQFCCGHVSKSRRCTCSNFAENTGTEIKF
eukprot:2147667-Rhodomonas_salina.1